jgi:hypothetical protein
MAVKTAALQALNDGKGAVAYMLTLKNSKVAEDRRSFVYLLGKLIPREVTIEGDLDVSGEPQIVVTLPDNARGPLPNETTEQYRARYEREVEARRDDNDSDGR